ncbi:MAG TPA: amidase family protein [Candidatus Binataceae bacterium]|nr:amidase family protein [Candidatus Binataceae bacterium]
MPAPFSLPVLPFPLPKLPFGSKFHLLDATIDDVQTAIKEHQLTCTELVEYYLARIKAYNGVCVDQPNGQLGAITVEPNVNQVNALMTLNLRPANRMLFGFDAHHARSQTDLVDGDPSMPDALETAAAEDASFKRTGKMSSLFCVPMAIKDEYDTFDMRTTSGADAPYANDRPPKDSVFVTRLRNAGAIILAKTNMGEYASGSDRSSWGGVMCNAYDSTRSAGHSSTGVGLAITTNMAMCGIGEESGGSIIHPANWSDDVGLAPTQELVPRTGMIQASLYNDRVGPICRTVNDTAKIMDVIAGYDPSDELTAFSVGQMPDAPYSSFTDPSTLKGSKPLAGIRIGVLREWDVPWTIADQESVDLMENAIPVFAKLGATIVDPGPNNNLFDDVIPQLFPYLESATFQSDEPGLFSSNSQMSEILALWFNTALYPSDVDAPNIRNLGPSNSTGELTYVLSRYLENRGDANIQTINDLATKSNFWVDPNMGTSQQSSLASAATVTTLSVTAKQVRRFTLEQIVRQKLAKDNIDVIIAPTTTIPPYVLTDPTEPTVHNRPSNGYSTLGANGIPELTVPSSFTTVSYDRTRPNNTLVGPVSTKLPFGILLQGAPFSEPLLLHVAAAYEQATHGRVPPPLFPPVPGEP